MTPGRDTSGFLYKDIAGGKRIGSGLLDQAVIPEEQHSSVGKETGETAHIERWNNTLRQRLGRFVRETLSFSRIKFDAYRLLGTLSPSLQSRKSHHSQVSHYQQWVYLSRAVDSEGNTLDFWLSTTRDGKAAQHFFLKTLAASHTMEPRVINVDKNASYPKAFNELKTEGRIPDVYELRQVKYLNNLIEQDHRFIKRLTKPGMAFSRWRQPGEPCKGSR